MNIPAGASPNGAAGRLRHKTSDANKTPDFKLVGSVRSLAIVLDCLLGAFNLSDLRIRKPALQYGINTADFYNELLTNGARKILKAHCR